MSIESLKQDLDSLFEGEIGTLEVNKYCCEHLIEGDDKNSLFICYRNGKEYKQEIRPKKKYHWQN